MKMLIIFLLAIATTEFSLALADAVVQKGPRGGCYTIRKSKTGKEYKKYAPCRKDAK